MPYQPRFSVTPHLLKTLEDIAAFREKILSASIQVPWIPALQRDARARNTHGSTAIEGNPLTLAEVRLLEEGRDLSTPTERAKREILNYLAGLRFIEKKSVPKAVKREDLFELHSIISRGVMDQGEAGRYRNFQVRVGNYLPPPASQVKGLMDELLEWWNQKGPAWSPVITAGVVHYRFEAIHPFADGNGRTGRMLALWELYRRGFDTHHIFSVDEVFWEKRPFYYKNLERTQQGGDDLTGWLEFNAEAVHLTLERVWSRVQHLRTGQGTGRIVLSPRQERLLGLLRERGTLSPREIWEGLGVTRQGSLKLMKPLLQAGLIEPIGNKKNRKYIFKTQGPAGKE